jgi:hypothetical protein
MRWEDWVLIVIGVSALVGGGLWWALKDLNKALDGE